MWNGEDFSIFTKSAVDETPTVVPFLDSKKVSVASVFDEPHKPFDISELNHDVAEPASNLGGRF
jgi:hypothetical protein